MRTMKASEFKAKCLKVLDEVAATGEPVRVTKRGKVVAELKAADGKTEPAEDKWALFQRLFPKGAVSYVGDSGLDPELSIWDELGGFEAHMERKFGYLWKDAKDAAE
jgi:antitoxin (DNA-binding transcriptional repressor) of toxin-antitoxin stability system